MDELKRWSVQDRQGNEIYLTQERWEHIIDLINHPEMESYEEHLKLTIQQGKRKQDPLNLQKFRYAKSFNDLFEANTHIIAIVLFRYRAGTMEEPVPNNYVVTAFQKEIG